MQTSEKIDIQLSGSLLARNSLMNFGGQLIPVMTGLLTIPFTLRYLGMDRFGLLSLVWVALGYLTSFDLGMSRASTKYVAELMGKGLRNQVPFVVWSAVVAQAFLGLVVGVTLWAVAPLLIERVFHIPDAIKGEAVSSIHVFSFLIPTISISSSFTGVLEAIQRFDLSNSVKAPVGAFNFFFALLGSFLGWGVQGIVLLIFIGRCVALLVLLILNLKTLPELKGFKPKFSLFPKLFVFGGWVTVTAIVGPFLVSADRFMVASLLPVAALGYYNTPYEMITRLWIIPLSMAATLFPAFSSLDAVSEEEKIKRLFMSSLKFTVLILGPVIAALILFSHEVIGLWLGPEFEKNSSLILQILGVGVLINSLGYVPYVHLQGKGRPDLPAKIQILQLPFYIAMVFFLVVRWGIVGAALAWTVRVLFETLLFFIASSKMLQPQRESFFPRSFFTTCELFLLLIVLGYVLKYVAGSYPLLMQVSIFVVLLTFFFWLNWKESLAPFERETIQKIIKRAIGSTSG